MKKRPGLPMELPITKEVTLSEVVLCAVMVCVFVWIAVECSSDKEVEKVTIGSSLVVGEK